jgi:hypothetical protein
MKKKPTKTKRIETRMENDSKAAIKRCSCDKCRGVIVRSYASSLMAQSVGKRCSCKTPTYNKDAFMPKRLKTKKNVTKQRKTTNN